MELETGRPTSFGQQGTAADIALEYGRFRYEEGECIGGRYYVHRRASGGFGQVYLCYDQEQHYFYALKTLKLSQAILTDPATWPRLQREVSLWIALGEHAHIVQCFNLETIDQLPFIILEWVADDARLSRLYAAHHAEKPHFLDWYARLGRRGLPLRQEQATRNQVGAGTSLAIWIQHHRLSPAFALQLLLDVCSGLSHAQSVHPDFVHRDLKPANVLLDEQLRAKVTDLGTAVLQRDLLDPGRQVGTPAYMAPEQWRGGTVDARTDIYALGCMLYEMLTQQLPFTTPDHSIEHLHWQHEHASPPPLPSHHAKGLDEIVQTCLQKSPADRFTSIAELASALTAAYETLMGRSPRAFIAAAPLNVEDRNKVAAAYYNLEQYDLALREFERAVALDPIYPNTFTNRGCIYHVLGQHEEALRDYALAIRLGHRMINAKVRNNRGLLYVVIGQVGRGLRDLKEAIELEPDYANAHVNLGLAYTVLHDFEPALVCYAQALQLNDKHVLAYHNRGYVYQQLGDSEAALTDYDAALTHAPLFCPARINRLALYTQLGLIDEALAEHQQLAQLPKTKPTDLYPIQAEAAFSRPDPQFINLGGLQDLVTRPIRERKVAQLYGQERRAQEMPLEAVVTVEEARYAEWLHPSVQARQREGQQVTQLALQVKVSHADGRYHPYSVPQEWQALLDEETMQMLASHGLRAMRELQGHRLVLRNEHPEDSMYPLRIWNIL